MLCDPSSCSRFDYSAWWICVLIVVVNWPVLLEWLQQARLAALPEHRGDKAAGRPRAALFDADCGFCRWSVRQILAWDRRGRVHAATIQSEEGERLLAEMPPGRRL